MTKYRNTGIFKKNTKLNETQETNKQLKDLYTTWYNYLISKGLSNICDIGKYNGMLLLTCFDSYIKAKNKIMFFGKEANSSDGQIDVFDNNYQNDAYYSYDYAICNPDKTKKSDRNNTFFLKTRKKISGLSDDENPSYDKVLSVLPNNLNKSSYKGKYTPCNNDIDDIIYSSDFTFNRLSGNIFIHELNILRPTHIAFLCGKGYNEHIKRDFGEKFYEMNKDAINQLSVRKSPVSDIITLKKHQIKDLFGIEGYDSINIVFAIHPSAHMKKDIRSSYEQSLIRFISNQI